MRSKFVEHNRPVAPLSEGIRHHQPRGKMKAALMCALVAAATAAVLLAAGCAETQLGAQAVKEVVRNSTATDTAAQTPAPELAPEAFDATGLTIWDGASTLEGVWVAHPLAQRA